MSGFGGLAIRAKMPFKSDEKPVEPKSEFGAWGYGTIVFIDDVIMSIGHHEKHDDRWDVFDWCREFEEITNDIHNS